MSRSYRKPYIVCGNGTKYKQYAKKEANRLIRRTRNVPDGKAYRKFFDSWNIDDYRYLMDINGACYKNKPWKYNRK